MIGLITLPPDAVSSSIAYIGEIFTGVGPFVWVAIGVPLGFYVVKKVIGLLPKR